MNNFGDIQEKVKSHTKNVMVGRVCFAVICPRCKGHPVCFKHYGCRCRIFLVIDGNYIRKLEGLLARKKCPLCGDTFTDYPPFALPRKHYLAFCLMGRSRRYVEDDPTSYRKGVTQEDMSVAYEKKNDGALDERCLAASTLWRWVGFVGSIVTVLRKALEMIRDKDPTSQIFRDPCVVLPYKYRSQERKMVLQRAMRIFGLEETFFSLFGIRIPEFATSTS